MPQAQICSRDTVSVDPEVVYSQRLCDPYGISDKRWKTQVQVERNLIGLGTPNVAECRIRNIWGSDTKVKSFTINNLNKGIDSFPMLTLPRKFGENSGSG